MGTAICKLCHIEKPLDQFNVVKGRVRKYVCYPCRGKRERAKQKLGLLEAFGWKCNCCGEDNPLFLTLQHKDRKGETFYGLKTHQLYSRAKADGWDSSKYEVLCMNCNFAHGIYGECPHRNGMTTEKVIAQLKAHATRVVREYGPLTEAQKEALKLGPLAQRKVIQSTKEVIN
jgi:hypothetical protein